MTWTEKENGLDIFDPSHWETLWPRAILMEISLPSPAPSIIWGAQGLKETGTRRAGAQFLTLTPKDTQTHSRSEQSPAATLAS